MSSTEKGRAIALLPIGVFLVIFLGSGIVMNDFYAMPAIVAFLIALAVAFAQNKELSFDDYDCNYGLGNITGSLCI